MAAIPPNIQPAVGVLTCGQSQAALAHVLNIIGDVDHHIEWSLTQYGIDDFTGLLTLPHADIDNFEYVDPAAVPAPAPVALLPHKRNTFKALLAMYAYYSRALTAAIDITTVTADNFNNWHVSGYNPNIPIVPFANHICSYKERLCSQLA